MPTYKPRQVIRDLLKKGCIRIKNNHGSHQKLKNPANGMTTHVPVHLGRDLKEHETKAIYQQVGLELDY